MPNVMMKKHLEKKYLNVDEPTTLFAVASIRRHRYKQGWRFLTVWIGYTLGEAPWEPISSSITGFKEVNEKFLSYCRENGLHEVFTKALDLSTKKKHSSH